MLKYKIGVYGSAGGDKEIAKATVSAEKIAEALVKANCVMITGACPGLPGVAAERARKLGGEVWGFSPMANRKEHSKFFPEDSPKFYSKIFFVPKTFPFANSLEVSRKYRNVVSTATCDAGIIIAGRWGTTHEFCSLHDYGKVIGVLTHSGGMADELPRLLRKSSKASKAKIIFDSSPQRLVGKVIKELKRVKK